MSTAAIQRTPVLADLIAGSRVRDATLVLSGTAFLAVAGQIVIPLWFTPVPISLATFAVLLTGAALGPARAAASVLIYLTLGLAGVPLFSQFGSGWAFASFGYILGYLVAVLIVGALARRGADRSLLATMGTAAIGSIAIYAIGLPWLITYLHVDFATGLQLGVIPFLVGDVVKTVAAALLLPATWKLIGRSPSTNAA